MSLTNLNSRIKKCKICVGLNQEASSESASTLNAPGFGDIKSKILIIGQSLCGDPCINSQIPFTEGCGILLDEAFDLSGIRKNQIYITNIVKCHPPKNRPSKAKEIKNCRGYLEEELKIAYPKIIICLGADARNHFDEKAEFNTNQELVINNKKIIVHFLYHPAYIQNRRPKLEREMYIETIANIVGQNYA